MKTAALLLFLLPTLASAADLCPLDIVPGVSFGPVALGKTLAELEKAGLPVVRKPGGGDTTFADELPLQVKVCGDRIDEVWISDLRLAPDCVRFAGKPIHRKLPKPEVFGLFKGCHPGEPRIGGAFEICEDGGLSVGHGMGDFVQLRVAPKGSNMEDECADKLDDGAPAELPKAERDVLLQKVLDLDVLAPFWHPDLPGRRPLRIKAFADTPALTLFGSKVVWIDALDGKPAFEFTKLESTKRRVRIEFRYAVEGVFGHLLFKRRGEGWYPTEKNVAER